MAVADDELGSPVHHNEAAADANAEMAAVRAVGGTDEAAHPCNDPALGK